MFRSVIASETIRQEFPAIDKELWCEITALGQCLPVSAAVTS